MKQTDDTVKLKKEVARLEKENKANIEIIEFLRNQPNSRSSRNASYAPTWKRLTIKQQLCIAKYASEHGLRCAAYKHNVSTGAVRRACAVTGIAPHSFLIEKEDRISRARAMLRALNVSPSELI